MTVVVAIKFRNATSNMTRTFCSIFILCWIYFLPLNAEAELVFTPFTDGADHAFTSPEAKSLFEFIHQKKLDDSKGLGPIELRVMEETYFGNIKESGSYASIGSGEFLVQGLTTYDYAVPAANKLEDVYQGYEPEVIAEKSSRSGDKWIFIKDSKLEHGITRSWFHVISIVRHSGSPTTINGEQLEVAQSISSRSAACGSRELTEAEHIVKYAFKDMNNDGIDDIVFEVIVRDCAATTDHRTPTKKRVAWVWDGTDWSRSVLHSK